MPISVVVGGQYGSEGKGKVALHIARTAKAEVVVRVGGPNSGHTGVDSEGKTWILRQLPASALAPQSLIVLPAGSLIDPDILEREIAELSIAPERLVVDGHASVVLPKHRDEERRSGLAERIGSTTSGTGASLTERIGRKAPHVFAKDHPVLSRYVSPFAAGLLREVLDRGKRVVVEGTQGFGLSIWHGGAYPHATSRDTTASGFLAEAGLAPQDVDDVVLVIRSFPIRVGGSSGPLENEIDWPTLASEANLPKDFVELTSATKRVRRVGRFHPDIVRRAIAVNAPHRIAMNHLDYVDRLAISGKPSFKARTFIASIESAIGRKIDLAGFGPSALVPVPADSMSEGIRYAGRT